MDDLDKKIVTELQDNFPIAASPYDIIAEKLGVGVDELWSRIERLLDDGTIRRIGVSLDSRKLGYSSTLAAVSVEDGQIDRAAEFIGRYPEVTHSYQRDGKFNIWFTLIACDEDRIDVILQEIAGEMSLEETQVVNAPVEKLFKLDARFRPPSK